MEFNQEEFNNFIVDNNIYGFFDEAITLKSGRKSHFYANWRNIVEDAYLTEKLANYLIAYAKNRGINVDTFFGVPEGATKLAVITQFLYAQSSNDYAKGSHVLSMGRAKPKDHGAPKDKYFVGMPQGKVIVIEDVTTTGGSLISKLDELKEAGIDIAGVVSLTNRMELRDDGKSVQAAIEEMGYNFYSMSVSTDILPIVYNKLNPNPEIGKAIESEFNEYGVNPIKLISDGE